MTTFVEQSPPQDGGMWPYPLYELTMAVASAREPAEIFEAALNALAASLDVERASVLLFDAQGVMRFRAWRGLSGEYRAAVDGHSPWVPDTKDAAPVLVEDVHADPELESLRPTFDQEGIRALAFIPLALGTHLLGKFMLYYAEPHAFTEWEVLTAQTIAAHVAFAIDQQDHRESEGRLRSVTDALPALVATTSVEGEIIDIDESYRQYTGLTLAQAQDWRNYQVIHPDDFEQAMVLWAEALASGEPLQNEMRLRRNDGTYRWHLMQAKPIRNRDGAIGRWVTVSVDIEDRKRAEARERYLAAITNSLVSPLESGDLLAEIARQAVPTLADVCTIGLFDETNQTVRVETATISEAERPFVEAIHLRAWRLHLDPARTIGEEITAGRPVCVPDATEAWARSCAPRDDQVEAALSLAPRSLMCLPLLARGETIGIVTFATTVSKRPYVQADFDLFVEVASRLSIALDNRQLYESLQVAADDLRHANAAKDEFLGLVSHELKTPITMILGNAEVLERRLDELDSASRSAALLDIHGEATRLHRIIENLLVLARLEQGVFVDREPMLVRRVVDAVVKDHRRSFPTRRFTFTWLMPSTPVLGSEQYLEQILRNLLSNAEKYSPAAAPIEIVGSRNTNELIVRVLDRGPGVSDDEVDQIFTPFYRSPATATLAHGVGIGLTVCRRLIEAQGGRIWAARRSDGGSEFGFSLPLAGDDEEEPATSAN